LGKRQFCAFCGRRDGKAYKLDHGAIMEKYGENMKLQGRIPDALSGAMGNDMYIANFETEEDLWAFYRALMETA